jgi:hypothetical protein
VQCHPSQSAGPHSPFTRPQELTHLSASYLAAILAGVLPLLETSAALRAGQKTSKDRPPGVLRRTTRTITLQDKNILAALDW